MHVPSQARVRGVGGLIVVYGCMRVCVHACMRVLEFSVYGCMGV